MRRLLVPSIVALLASAPSSVAEAEVAAVEPAAGAPVPPSPAPAAPAQAGPVVVTEPGPYAVPPPPGYPTTYAAPQPPFVYTPSGWVAVDPAATSAMLDRADRGLAIERTGIVVGAVGMVAQVFGYAFLLTSTTCGTTDCIITDPSRYDAASAVVGIGYALGTGGLVAGGSGALMASNQLRLLGVPNHRRGLAIASPVLGFFPFHLPAFIMETVHLSRTRAIVRDLRLTVQPRVSYGLLPMTNPETRTFGTRFVLRF